MSVSLEAIELVESAFDMDLLLRDGIAFAYEPTLLEAFFQKKKWDKTKHPRWPAGTPKAPDGSPRAGTFMRVGQRFTLKGTDYEVAHVVGGVVYAHVASGKYADTKTVALKPTTVEDGGLDIVGVTPAAPKVIKGGHKGSGSNVTIIDPYVDHASHDPSIPAPTGFSPQEWARFGKVDQQHYIELMERFGGYDPKTTQSIHNKVYDDYEGAVQNLVKSAYGTQFGHSYESHLALWKAFGGGDPAKGQAKREKAKELQNELGSVLQWDLYNRTRSPDIFAVHKTSDAPNVWSKMIHGETPLFAGLSQTFHWRPDFFGHVGVFTPLAIRHITLATISAQPIPGQSHFADTSYGVSEREISVPEQLAIDGRSRAIANSSMTPAMKKWLEGTTSEPRGGEYMEQFYEMLDKGGVPPVAPAAFSIQMKGAGAKQWADPPAGAAAMTKGWKVPGEQSEVIEPEALGKMDLDIDFKFVEEDGTPKLMTALDSGFQAGDFMLGKKGTLFWVGTDPGDPTGYGLIYHKIVDGQFVGEQYNFTSTESKRYRLVQTFAEPPPPLVEGAPGWEPQAWAQTLEKEFVGKLKKGDKFKVGGHGYELLADGNMQAGTVDVLVLESGLPGAVNTDYKTPLLVPKEDYVPPVAPDPATMTAGQQFKLPGKLLTAAGEGGLPTPVKWIVSLGAEQGGTKTYTSPLLAKAAFDSGEHSGALVASPQVGDVFPWDGTKHTITSILKDGTIRAKAQGGTKVWPFTPGSDAHAKIMQEGFFRPGDWVHNPGQKVKLSSLQVGELFDTGAGAKLSPAVVTGKAGAKVTWKSLTTGAEDSSMGHKAVRQIVAKGEVSLESEGMPAVPEVAASEGKFDASKYKEGPGALWKDIPDGALMTMAGMPFKKLNMDTALNLDTDKPIASGWASGKANPGHQIHSQKITLLIAKDLATGPFEHDKLVKGDEVQLINLIAGDQFMANTSFGTGFVYEVLAPSDGESKAKVAVVLPGGGFGPVKSLGNPKVKFQKFKGDPSPVGVAEPGIDIDDDVEGFQNALEVGLTPYASKWGSGGKYVHYRIKEMTVGAHFRDTSGNVWIVKHAGPISVITDGVNNYKVDGALRGRVLDAKTKIDSSPPLGTEPAKKDAMAGLGAAPDGSTVGDYAFKAGDKFAHQGVVYEVNYTGPGSGADAHDTVHATAVVEGFALGFQDHDPITHVSAGVEAATPVQVGSVVTLKAGTLFKTTETEKFTVVGMTEFGDYELDNNLGGQVIVSPFAITSVQPPPASKKNAPTVMPKVGDTVAAGYVNDTNPDHPDGPKVEITGHNLGEPVWMPVADALASPFKLGDVVYTAQGHAVTVTGFQSPYVDGFVLDGGGNKTEGAWLPEELSAEPALQFTVGQAVGEGKTWKDVAVGDTFTAAGGGGHELTVVASEPGSNFVTLASDAGTTTVVPWTEINPTAVYLGKTSSVTSAPGGVPAATLKVGDTFTFSDGALNSYVVDSITSQSLKATNPVTGSSWEGDIAPLGPVYDVVPAATPDAGVDDYLGADFWPDSEPLPKVGDTVWYLDAAFGKSKGVVGDILPSGEYGINPDDGGFTVWVPEHDLLRPGTLDKGPTPADLPTDDIKWFAVGADAWTLGGAHGVVKEDQNTFKKYLLLDDGTALEPESELYVTDPLQKGDASSHLGGAVDPAAGWKVGDKALVVKGPWEGFYVTITDLTQSPLSKVPRVEVMAANGAVGLIDLDEIAPVPSVASPVAQQVYSAGEPMFGAEGKPIIKGHKYALKFGIGSPEYGTALGSGNAPGTVMVELGDGGKTEVEPSYFFTEDVVPEPASQYPPTGSLQPYASAYGSGGKYKHDPIGSLSPGTAFTDKSKAKFTVVGHVGSDATIYEDAAGAQFSTKATNRVRKLADAPVAAPAPEPTPVPKPVTEAEKLGLRPVEDMTFGDLKKGDKFSPPSYTFDISKPGVWTVLGVGTVSGWAKSESGEDKNFPLYAKVGWHLPAGPAPVAMNSHDLTPGDIFVIGPGSYVVEKGTQFMLLSHAFTDEAAKIKVVKTPALSGGSKRGDVIDWGKPGMTPLVKVQVLGKKAYKPSVSDAPNVPLPKAATTPQKAFFNQLGNGDPLAVYSAGAWLPAKVTDNQSMGMGVTVSVGGGPGFEVHAHEVSPRATEGEEAVSVHELKVGDVYVDAPDLDPAEMGYLVNEVTATHVHATALGGSGSGSLPVGWPAAVYRVKPPGSSGSPEQESAALPVASINSYGSPYGPGGKYKHPHIDALKSSDVFRDKDGAKFVFSHVLSTPTENYAVVMRQSDNEFVKLPVWVTNAKGKLVKSRVRVVE